MATNPRLPFEEESAEDSIATDTTAESEERDEYDVETILAERHDEDGEVEYLVKWAGYQIQRASWEPPENFNNDHFFALWKQQKDFISSGKAKAFDVTAWQATQDRDAEARFRRQQRRKAKRRRRGLQVSSDDGISEASEAAVAPATKKKARKQVVTDSEDDQIFLNRSPRKKTVQRPPSQRKGIARRTDQPRRHSETKDQRDVRYSSGSEMDSLFEEAAATARPSLVRAATSPAKPMLAPKSAMKKPSMSGTTAATVPIHKQPIARKSAPGSTAVANKAKRTNESTIFANWTEGKKQRQRARVSGETPKDSTDPKFTRLSTQNKYQKYSVNEPAPNIDALDIVDPKTGKIQPPKVASALTAANMRKVTEEIHSAYGRRTSTLVQRERSRTPPSPATRRASIPAPIEPRRGSILGDHSVIQPPSGPAKIDPRRSMTCKYWKVGDCRFNERTCAYAHREVTVQEAQEMKLLLEGNAPKNLTTCWYWRKNGMCKKPDAECEFAHYDTGIYTGQPGTYNAGTGRYKPVDRHDESAQSPITNSDDVPADHVDISGTNSRTIHTETISNIVQPQTVALMETTLEIARKDRSVPIVLPAKLEMTSTAPFEDIFTPGNKLHFDIKHMVKATDLQHHMRLSESLQPVSVGTIAPWLETRRTLEMLATTCKSYYSAFVTVRSGTMVVMFPCRVPGWGFLDGGSPDAPPHAVFHFRMMRPKFNEEVLENIGTLPSLLSDGAASVASIEGPKVNFDLSYLPLGDKAKPEEQNIFIFLSQQQQAEFAALADHFEGLGCKVYNSAAPGTWNLFRQRYYKACLILIPSDIQVWEIPGLHTLVATSRASVKVALVTFSQSLLSLKGATLTPMCQRLFPYGTVTLITDEVFVYHPEKANEIIQGFLGDTAPKPIGAETSKIATRPGIKAWLEQKAQQHANERGRQDTCWVQLYASICSLCPLEAEDPFDPPNPLPSSHLVSDPIEQFPSFLGLWEKDASRATDMLVEWFAGWSACNAPNFRRFVVCYEPKGASFVVNQTNTDPRGWTRKYQHIGVETPDVLMKRFKAVKK